MSYQTQSAPAPAEENHGDSNRILVTTTPALEGYHITRYIEIVSAETVLGTGFFSELAAWVADRFGGESKTTAWKIRTARESSLQKLRENARNMGANAVIGTSFACSSNSRGMISVIITGTAVNVVPIQ